MIPSGRPTPGRRHSTGQSLPEFLIVLPVFLFLVLLIFQLVLIYRAKTTLDYATLEAARRGAIHGADVAEMRKGLAQGLTPLYATSTGLTDVAIAYGRARADLAINGDIEVVSPTRAMWDAYRERQYDGRQALPNDSLAFRDRAIRGGEVNVQDANLLKIRVTYYYPLVVPFVDLVLRGRSRYVQSDGIFDPSNVELRHPLLGGPFMGDHYRIELESQAVVQMQSPIHERTNLR
ncbi:MAG TPA: TadE/TadG family type IV pilus assembly protein [Luteimonas sp.]